MALSTWRNRRIAAFSALGFSTCRLGAHRQRADSNINADRRSVLDRWDRLAILQVEAGEPVPAVRLTATSRMDPLNRRCSTISTRPILGSISALPSTRAVSGPLPARNPCSCLRLSTRIHRRDAVVAMRG